MIHPIVGGGIVPEVGILNPWNDPPRTKTKIFTHPGTIPPKMFFKNTHPGMIPPKFVFINIRKNPPRNDPPHLLLTFSAKPVLSRVLIFARNWRNQFLSVF